MRSSVLALLASAFVVVGLVLAPQSSASDASAAAVFAKEQPLFTASYGRVLEADAAYFKKPTSASRQRRAITRLRQTRVIIDRYRKAMRAQTTETPAITQAAASQVAGLNDVRVALGRIERGLRAVDLRRAKNYVGSLVGQLRFSKRTVRGAEVRASAAAKELQAAEKTFAAVPKPTTPGTVPTGSALAPGDAKLHDDALVQEKLMAPLVTTLERTRTALVKDPYGIPRYRAVRTALADLAPAVATYRQVLSTSTATSEAGQGALRLLQQGMVDTRDGYAIIAKGNREVLSGLVAYRDRPSLKVVVSLNKAIKRAARSKGKAERLLRRAERRCDRGLQLLGYARRAPR